MSINTPDFFTATNYKDPNTFGQKAANAVENYFDLGGRKVFVLANENKHLELSHEKSRDPGWVELALKIASYFTVILPLIMFVGKLIFRATHNFVEKSESASVEAEVVVVEEKKGFFAKLKSPESQAKDYAKTLNGRVTENEWIINKFGEKQYIFSEGANSTVKIQEVVKGLGSGTFGEIKMLRNIKTGEKTKLKVAMPEAVVETAKTVLEKEVKNLLAINKGHDGIPGIQNSPLRGVVRITHAYAPKKISSAYEGKLYDGSLSDLINANLPIENRIAIAKQIVAGVTHLHNNDWYHGDLSPKNILYRENKDGSYSVAIIDFAGSTQNPVEDNTGITTRLYYPESERAVATKNEDYKQIEMFALGRTLFKLLIGKSPNAKKSKYIKSNLVQLQEVLNNDELAKVINGMLSPTEIKWKLFKGEVTVWNRPTAKEVLLKV